MPGGSHVASMFRFLSTSQGSPGEKDDNQVNHLSPQDHTGVHGALGSKSDSNGLSFQ